MILISLLPAYAHCTGVLINEVLADPPPGLSGDANGDGLRHTYEDEFVELIHTGSDTISLAQWKIGDDDTSPESFFTFPAGTSLAPGQLLVLFGGGSPSLPSITAYIDDGRIGNGLSNGGDAILLLDALGDTVDIVRVAAWPDDQSLARSTGGFFTPHSAIAPTSFSPGQLNHLRPDSTASHVQPAAINETDGQNDPPATVRADSTHSTDIFIRQILADPPDGIAGDSNGDGQRHTYEDEFVELVYTGTDTLSLDGWRIGDDDISTNSYFTFPANTKLVPKAHLVLFGGRQPAPSSFLAFGAGGRIGNGLSNSGDTILLLNAQGQVVDSAVGRSWPANQSVVRTSSHTDFAPHTALYDSPYSLPTASEENDSLSPSTNAEENERSLPDSSGHTRGDSTRAARPSNLQLAISEILADPPNDANGDGQYSAYADEFIELFNGGDPVDLSGWYLSDDDTPLEKKFVFPVGSILRTGQYLVLFGGGQKPASDQILAFVDDGRIGDGLANTGDRILLHQSNGDTILNLLYTHADIDQSLHFDSGHAIPHGRLPASALYSPGENRPLYQQFSIQVLPLHEDQKGQVELYGHTSNHIDSLKAHTVQWLSTDTSTASIDHRGIINANRIGTTRIEAWSDSFFLAQKNLSILAREPPPNTPPTIISTPAQNTVYAGGTYRYQVEAQDRERATLVYTLAQAPAGFTLHYASGLLSGRAPTSPGAYPIRIEVTDGRGGLAAQDYLLHVQIRPQLRISEVLADPPLWLRGDANGDQQRHAYEDEFVEILNNGSESVDLGNMRLGDARKTTFIFPPRTHLAPGARTVVFGGSTSPNNLNFFYANGRIGDGLGNQRDTVYLLSPDGGDTLATAAYDLEHSPHQSLVWVDSSAIPHASSGVDQPFSAGEERPTLTNLSLADSYLSMLAGEVHRPTLIAHWSNGSKHRLGERAHWTSSDSAIIRITHDNTLHALAPGHSSITAHFGEHSIPPYHLKVHRRLEELLSFSPQDSIVQLRRGQEQIFTVEITDPQRLSYTWYINGQRSPPRKPQRIHTCCQEHIDTIYINLKRGREYLQHQWFVSTREADKRVVAKLPPALTTAIRPFHRAYPNPFNSSIHIEFSSPHSSISHLDIYDVRGRHVRTLLSSALRTGYHRTTWDGRNDKGQQVASNIYFYRVQYGATKGMGKIVLLR